MRASHRVSCFSSGTKQEAVKDVAHSRSTMISRRLVNQGAWKRPQGSTSVASRCYSRDGIVHVQSEEMTLEYHLKLMAGRMVEFDMKGGKEAVQDGSRDDDGFRNWSER